jgi:hypothetical protein
MTVVPSPPGEHQEQQAARHFVTRVRSANNKARPSDKHGRALST